MKGTSILIFLTTLISFKSTAQLDQVGALNRLVLENWNGQYIRVGSYKVRGTPMLFGQALDASYKFQGDSASKNGKFLYNLMEQKAGPAREMEIIEYDRPVERFTVNIPERFGGNQATFKLDTYPNSEVSKKGLVYFNVLEEGKNYHFLKLYKIKVAMDPTNMYDKELRVFENYFEYYIYNVKSMVLKKVKLSSKNILGALDDAAEAEQKAKDQNTSFTDELQVAALVKSLN